MPVGDAWDLTGRYPTPGPTVRCTCGSTGLVHRRHTFQVLDGTYSVHISLKCESCSGTPAFQVPIPAWYYVEHEHDPQTPD